MKEKPSEERIRKLKAEVKSVFDKHGYRQYFFGFYDEIGNADHVASCGGMNYLKGSAQDILEGTEALSKDDWLGPPLKPPPDDGDEWKHLDDK